MAITWASLRALWDERDSRYRERRQHGHQVPVSPAEAASIRDYRRTEVAMLPSTERGLAMLALNNWAPPAGLA